ncbi:MULTISPECIES: DUF3175 domain-containing protein [unclassified Synechococcus]|nr:MULTISPECIES: DUF3175 domain-containing protein [unclassified Synechococcus]
MPSPDDTHSDALDLEPGAFTWDDPLHKRVPRQRHGD